MEVGRLHCTTKADVEVERVHRTLISEESRSNLIKATHLPEPDEAPGRLVPISTA